MEKKGVDSFNIRDPNGLIQGKEKKKNVSRRKKGKIEVKIFTTEKAKGGEKKSKNQTET